MRSPSGKNHLVNLFPRPPKMLEYVAESLTTLRISSISRLLSMQDADTSEILLVYNISTNFKYWPVFFLLDLWLLRTLCFAINPSEKNSFCNMQCGPRTRLVRGISCSPNFPCTSIPRCTHAKYGPILYESDNLEYPVYEGDRYFFVEVNSVLK